MNIIENSGMDALRAITTRFSVRQYTQQPVSGKELDTILNAGFCAPSACNLRPWDIIVIRDMEKLDAFAKKGRYQKMLLQAPLALVVCGNEKRSLTQGLMINDCSAMIENILLAAHSIGLGACWCGLAQKREISFVRERLSIPENILPIGVIAVGHPGEHRVQRDRFDPAHVHYEAYNGDMPQGDTSGKYNTV